jgi:hypothetical protein
LPPTSGGTAAEGVRPPPRCRGSGGAGSPAYRTRSMTSSDSPDA